MMPKRIQTTPISETCPEEETENQACKRQEDVWTSPCLLFDLQVNFDGLT